MTISRCFVAAAFCAFLFGAASAPAQPKPAPAPDTYSFTAVSSLIGPEMTIQVNRNGSKELIERTALPRPGVAQPFHDRVLYDFQAHRLFTLDLNSNLCSTQQYDSAYAPELIDPIGGIAAMSANMPGNPPGGWKHEVVNGIAAKVAETAAEGVKSKVWLDEKYGFLVKVAMAQGSTPLQTHFEMRRVAFAPSPASLFVAPQGCQAIGGVSNANGGHAELNAEVSVPTQTHNLGQPAAGPIPQFRVTSVRLKMVPEVYTGACPMSIKLVAEITTDGPGKVWYHFLAGMLGSPEGELSFTGPGTRTVAIEGQIRETPRVPTASFITAMERPDGTHPPQTTSSGRVNYGVTCRK